MRVVVVSGICVARDAISAAAAAQAELLASMPEVEDVTLVSQFCDRETPVPHVRICDPWSFVRHPVVQAADLVIFHWGISYALFDALPLVTAERRAVVHFHNLTPPELVAASDRARMEQSLVQIQLPAMTGTPMWTMSEYNLRTLSEWEFDPALVRFVGFPIEPPRALVPSRRAGVVRFLTVGRLVHSKGVDVLVDALHRAAARVTTPVELVLVGSADLSHTGFMADLRESIERSSAGEMISIADDVDDDELWRQFELADVVVSPSFHEGLCVPVIEGYHAGCRVIGTDAGNLPFVVQPPDPVVAAGDVAALADAIVQMTESIASGQTAPPPGAAAVVERYSRGAVEQQTRAAIAALA